MQELFSNLGINWKILLAQMVNFAILFFLLRKFLYRPLIGMLEKRREEIADANRRSDDIQKRLNDIEEAKTKALANARAAGEVLIKQAEVQAIQAAERVASEARAAAERAAVQERKAMRLERDKIREELKRELGTTIALAVESSVGDILDAHAKTKLVEGAVESARRYAVKA